LSFLRVLCAGDFKTFFTAETAEMGQNLEAITGKITEVAIFVYGELGSGLSGVILKNSFCIKLGGISFQLFR